MDLGIKDRVAIVCGASAGMGRATAESLAREGARVAICARHRTNLETAARDLRKTTGSEVLAYPANVTQPESIEEFLAEVRKHFGPPEILVNNAGGPPAGTLEELQVETWEQAHRLTFQSVVTFCRGVIPDMKARNWGRILTITSLTVKQPAENLILSNSYRSAVTAFSKTLVGELAGHGITINCVCPGYTDTERLNELAENIASKQKTSVDQVRRNWETAIPAGRLGRPAEVADLIAFLVSERAAYITGASILIDGGFIRGMV